MRKLKNRTEKSLKSELELYSKNIPIKVFNNIIAIQEELSLRKQK